MAMASKLSANAAGTNAGSKRRIVLTIPANGIRACERWLLFLDNQRF